jgi:tetratricopeptide (TPR) repeat protein
VPLGEYARLAASLREANALAEQLGDQNQLGEIAQSMTNYLRLVGDCDEALQAGLRARAFGIALGNRGLELSSTYQIGLVYRQLGDYPGAIKELRTLVDTLVGERLHDRFGSPAVLSVHARAWMATALAELVNSPKVSGSGRRRSRSRPMRRTRSARLLRIFAWAPSISAREVWKERYPL